jgi:hypothetical protein
MLKHLRFLGSLAVSLTIGGSALASYTVVVPLTNAQENPPTVPTLTTGLPRPASFGTATLTINDAQTAISWTATINNIDFNGSTPDINDDALNAHIHAGPTITPTTNGPVVWGFLGSPFNDTSPQDIQIVPFTTGVGATITSKWDAPEGNGTTLLAQLGNLAAGRAYMNFHTKQFTGGELRGNIAIPEPASIGILAGTAGSLALRRRRNRG